MAFSIRNVGGRDIEYIFPKILPENHHYELLQKNQHRTRNNLLARLIAIMILEK